MKPATKVPATAKEVKQFIVSHPKTSTYKLVKKFGITELSAKMCITQALKKVGNENSVLLNDNSYNNANGDEKMRMRKIIIQAIIDSGIFVGKIFSLSHEDTIFEEMLIKAVLKNKFDITCHELNEQTYKNLCAKVGAKGLLFNLSKQDIFESIKDAREGSISHLNLDFCGQIDKVRHIVTTAMENKVLAIGGVLALTLNNRNSAKNGVIDQMLSIIEKKDNVKVVEHCLTSFLLSVGNLNYTVKATPYNDVDVDGTGKTKGNMILYIITRLK